MLLLFVTGEIPKVYICGNLCKILCEVILGHVGLILPNYGPMCRHPVPRTGAALLAAIEM